MTMHREKISALMDGEMLDSEVLHRLAQDTSLQQTWERYHLVRDVLRGDTGNVLHFDISSRVMAAIASEPARSVQPLIPEAQPTVQQWRKMPWWNKLRPVAGQLSQMAVAACVSLVVIIGVQHYHNAPVSLAESEPPVLNTVPMMGQASPVSLGVPASGISENNQQQMAQEQYRRINALLQDYNIQRRLHSEQLQMASPVQTSQQNNNMTDNNTINTNQPTGIETQ